MARRVTRTIRMSPAMAEPAVTQSVQPREIRNWKPPVDLKVRSIKDGNALSISADAPAAPAQGERPENQFRLQVDRQTKASYATYEAAEAAGLALKASHPILHVAVHDAKTGVNRVIASLKI